MRNPQTSDRGACDGSLPSAPPANRAAGTSSPRPLSAGEEVARKIIEAERVRRIEAERAEHPFVAAFFYAGFLLGAVFLIAICVTMNAADYSERTPANEIVHAIEIATLAVLSFICFFGSAIGLGIWRRP